MYIFIEREKIFFSSCPKVVLNMVEHGNIFIGVILAYNRNAKGVRESLSVVKIFLKEEPNTWCISVDEFTKGGIFLWRNGARGVAIAVMESSQKEGASSIPWGQYWVQFCSSESQGKVELQKVF